MSRIIAHSKQVTRTAHYYTLGEPGPHIRYFFLVCHGYGQLAETFIRKFDALAADDVFVLAAEGLSRFYWGGLDGPVAASWMTRGNRLDEIADFTRLLQGLYDDYLPRLHPQVCIILLGFSQGVATQVRWIHRFQPRYDRLLLWAGTIPEDLDYEPHLAYFNAQPIELFYGSKDPLISQERIDWHTRMVAAKGLHTSTHRYEGKHTVDRVTLQNWLQAFRKVQD